MELRVPEEGFRDRQIVDEGLAAGGGCGDNDVLSRADLLQGFSLMRVERSDAEGFKGCLKLLRKGGFQFCVLGFPGRENGMVYDLEILPSAVEQSVQESVYHSVTSFSGVLGYGVGPEMAHSGSQDPR